MCPSGNLAKHAKGNPAPNPINKSSKVEGFPPPLQPGPILADPVRGMEPRRDLFDADRIQRRADVGLLFGDVCSASMPDRCRYAGNHGLVRCGLEAGDEPMMAALYA